MSYQTDEELRKQATNVVELVYEVIAADSREEAIEVAFKIMRRADDEETAECEASAGRAVDGEAS